MKFIDRAKIFVQSGNGGNGCVSFRRERCVPEGGPDGGDGGKGGSIIFLVDSNKETLIDFANRVHYKASTGESGSGSCCYGKNAEDIIIRIPRGTQIWSEDKETLFFDAINEGEKFVLLPGGKGGIGNVKFASSTNQTPKTAKAGEPGTNMWVWLVLKIFADIGYVGFPNAGKSSLLKLLTGSNTKVANYPFTTLHPELGALWQNDAKLLMADLPGIISKAHENKGLGLQFLGHIERCVGILHVIDVSNLNAKNALEAMLYEIGQFSEALLHKKQVVALNKIDLIDEKDLHEQIDSLKEYDIEIFPISCQEKLGVQPLVDALFKLK